MKEEDAQLVNEVINTPPLDLLEQIWGKAKKKGWKGKARFFLWLPVFIIGYGLLLWGKMFLTLIDRVKRLF